MRFAAWVDLGELAFRWIGSAFWASNPLDQNSGFEGLDLDPIRVVT